MAGYAVLLTGTGSAVSLGTQGISTTRSGIERLKVHFGAAAVGILDVLSALRTFRRETSGMPVTRAQSESWLQCGQERRSY